VLRELDDELAASSKRAGKQLVWDASGRAVLDLIAAKMHRRVDLDADYRRAEDTKSRVKLCAEVRPTGLVNHPWQLDRQASDSPWHKHTVGQSRAYWSIPEGESSRPLALLVHPCSLWTENENCCLKGTLDDTSKGRNNMGTLSTALTDLAGRIKRVEESAAAMQQKNRAALQQRSEELEAAIDEEKTELEAAVTQAKEAARGWWLETKNAIEAQVTEMRADLEKWQAAKQEKHAERAADDAEDDAKVAVSLAAYCLDAAEWAVVRAHLARSEADQVAANSQGS
jgi:hypothetical protein